VGFVDLSNPEIQSKESSFAFIGTLTGQCSTKKSEGFLCAPVMLVSGGINGSRRWNRRKKYFSV
jgi:hypothetical protein